MAAGKGRRKQKAKKCLKQETYGATRPSINENDNTVADAPEKVSSPERADVLIEPARSSVSATTGPADEDLTGPISSEIDTSKFEPSLGKKRKPGVIGSELSCEKKVKLESGLTGDPPQNGLDAFDDNLQAENNSDKQLHVSDAAEPTVAESKEARVELERLKFNGDGKLQQSIIVEGRESHNIVLGRDEGLPGGCVLKEDEQSIESNIHSNVDISKCIYDTCDDPSSVVDMAVENSIIDVESGLVKDSTDCKETHSTDSITNGTDAQDHVENIDDFLKGVVNDLVREAEEMSPFVMTSIGSTADIKQITEVERPVVADVPPSEKDSNVPIQDMTDTNTSTDVTLADALEMSNDVVLSECVAELQAVTELEDWTDSQLGQLEDDFGEQLVNKTTGDVPQTMPSSKERVRSHVDQDATRTVLKRKDGKAMLKSVIADIELLNTMMGRFKKQVSQYAVTLKSTVTAIQPSGNSMTWKK